MFTPREGLADPNYNSGLTSTGEEVIENDRAKANLYFYSEIYNALKHPDPEDVIRLRNLAARHLGERDWRILDPACGPANWLKAFSNGRNVLVGNDRCDAMVHFAARQLASDKGRAVCGDSTTCRCMASNLTWCSRPPVSPASCATSINYRRGLNSWANTCCPAA